MAGDFGKSFLVSVSHETKHENSSKSSGKIRSKIRGNIWDENWISFCNFSDLTNTSIVAHLCFVSFGPLDQAIAEGLSLQISPRWVVRPESSHILHLADDWRERVLGVSQLIGQKGTPKRGREEKRQKMS